MGEAKVGEEFITHEYDEAIAVQQCIVDAETKLSTKHPVETSRAAIKSALAEDKDFLKQLKALGKPHGATGKIEDVAEGLKSLPRATKDTKLKSAATAFAAAQKASCQVLAAELAGYAAPIATAKAA